MQRLVGTLELWKLLLPGVVVASNNMATALALGALGTFRSVAATIAAFSMAFAWLGLRLGHTARRSREKPTEIGAGLLLLALAGAIWLGWL